MNLVFAQAMPISIKQFKQLIFNEFYRQRGKAVIVCLRGIVIFVIVV